MLKMRSLLERLRLKADHPPAGRRVTAPPQRRRARLEPLEDRILFSTTLFLDFGAGVGMNNSFDVTAVQYRDIFGANTGTNLTDDGLAANGTLRFTPLAYDFDLDSDTDNDDITALTNAVLPLAQRALEPFDINLVVRSSANLAAAVTEVAANAGDASGEFDAYVFVMTVTSDDFDGVDGGAFISVGNQTGLFGEAAVTDLGAQTGNNTDEAALTFADNVFGSTSGTQGTAAFNANLAQRMAYTAVHEAFHTFSYVHTPDESTGASASADQRLLASGDVIRRGSVTREDPFIITRYDLQHLGAAVPEPNNYLLAANDGDIGLRDADSSGRPDLAYVTGTGANDLVTLANGGGGIVNVGVNPFNDQARSTAISSESYTIDLATDTDGTILVDASINADEVRVDATIDAAFRVRGGQGVDGSAEKDLLTLQSGGLNGTYTDLGNGSGTVNYATGASIAFSEFEDMEADNVAIAVNPLTLSSAILDEGGTLDLSGAFVNIDTLDTHQIVISWGDGSASTVLNLAAGARAFNASHKYLDDNPTGTSSDGYAISVTVTDQDDDTGSRAAAVIVRQRRAKHRHHRLQRHGNRRGGRRDRHRHVRRSRARRGHRALHRHRDLERRRGHRAQRERRRRHVQHLARVPRRSPFDGYAVRSLHRHHRHRRRRPRVGYRGVRNAAGRQRRTRHRRVRQRCHVREQGQGRRARHGHRQLHRHRRARYAQRDGRLGRRHGRRRGARAGRGLRHDPGKPCIRGGRDLHRDAHRHRRRHRRAPGDHPRGHHRRRSEQRRAVRDRLGRRRLGTRPDGRAGHHPRACELLSRAVPRFRGGGCRRVHLVPLPG